MKDQKKNYQEPALNVVKMKHCARLLAGSNDAEEGHADPARQNDMLDD